jgi:3-deoxy-7-phosphoheptulonate synthase
MSILVSTAPQLKLMDPLILPPTTGNATKRSKPSKPINSWTPQSWLSKPVIAQAVVYEDPKALLEICKTIASLPPLVSPVKIEIARNQFHAAALGKAFIMQGGDCAESFLDVQLTLIKQKIELLEQQSEILCEGLNLPIIKVGRIAGQYAKPRSSPFEILPNGTKVHAFRGHNVNGPGICDRTPDPQRLLRGYLYSRATLDLMKRCQASMAPTFLDCTQSELATIPSSTNHPPYHPIKAYGHNTSYPSMSLNFNEDGSGAIFTSHEALHLPLETAVTHNNYNTSATFVWVGERTRQLNGAHLEYIRGLRNPLGIKVGCGMTGPELVQILDLICPDPNNSDCIGHVTITTRLGADNVDRVLPPLIKAVMESGHQPVWMCDPCHGNTVVVSGIKTRCADRVLKEVVRTYDTHRRNGSFLGGLHLEQTGEAVTECLDQSIIGPNHAHGLEGNYRSLCDPRLSNAQALNLVRKFVEFVQKG